MRLTASSLARVSACAASAVLPRIESDNIHSTAGTGLASFSSADLGTSRYAGTREPGSEA